MKRQGCSIRRAAWPRPAAQRQTMRAACTQRRHAKTRRARKRHRSRKGLLLLAAACVCLAVLRTALSAPRLHDGAAFWTHAADAAIVSPDLGGAWDAETEAALRALARRRPEVRQMLEQPEAWPAEVAALLARNEEAIDFVLAYPSLAGTTPPDAVEEARQGTFPALLQWDARWGASPYAGGILALTGCGPTALSIVTCGLTGQNAWTPAAVAAWAQGEGYATESGTDWALLRTGCAHFGLRAEELPLTESAVFGALEKGQPIICSMRPGDFTTAGHFIVLTGVEEGQIRLIDPNSPARTAALWPFERLSRQIKNLWAYTAA